MRTARRGRGVYEGIDAGAESILLGGEIFLLEDAIAPLSIRVVIQVIGLEKEGDLNGEGFNRGTRRDGPLRGSGAGQKHPASPEHRSGSVVISRATVALQATLSHSSRSIAPTVRFFG